MQQDSVSSFSLHRWRRLLINNFLLIILILALEEDCGRTSDDQSSQNSIKINLLPWCMVLFLNQTLVDCLWCPRWDFLSFLSLCLNDKSCQQAAGNCSTMSDEQSRTFLTVHCYLLVTEQSSLKPAWLDCTKFRTKNWIWCFTCRRDFVVAHSEVM